MVGPQRKVNQPLPLILPERTPRLPLALRRPAARHPPLAHPRGNRCVVCPLRRQPGKDVGRRMQDAGCRTQAAAPCPRASRSRPSLPRWRRTRWRPSTTGRRPPSTATRPPGSGPASAPPRHRLGTASSPAPRHGVPGGSGRLGGLKAGGRATGRAATAQVARASPTSCHRLPWLWPCRL